MRVDLLSRRLKTLTTADGDGATKAWSLTVHPTFVRVTATTPSTHDSPVWAFQAATALLDGLPGEEFAMVYQARIAVHSEDDLGLGTESPRDWKGVLEVGLRDA